MKYLYILLITISSLFSFQIEDELIYKSIGEFNYNELKSGKSYGELYDKASRDWQDIVKLYKNISTGKSEFKSNKGKVWLATNTAKVADALMDAELMLPLNKEHYQTIKTLLNQWQWDKDQDDFFTVYLNDFIKQLKSNPTDITRYMKIKRSATLIKLRHLQVEYPFTRKESYILKFDSRYPDIEDFIGGQLGYQPPFWDLDIPDYPDVDKFLKRYVFYTKQIDLFKLYKAYTGIDKGISKIEEKRLNIRKILSSDLETYKLFLKQINDLPTKVTDSTLGILKNTNY